MNHAPPPRFILALYLLIPLALLAASCGGNSDNPTSEDSAPTDRRDSQPDSQNSQGFWLENDNPQSFGQNRATAITVACALRQDGTITCWGNNEYGQLGNGQIGPGAGPTVPVAVIGVNDATQITASGAHTCALREGGTITCWGNNSRGQLGNGQIGPGAGSTVPVEVLGINDATQITAGGGNTCALRQDGTITCWGNNDSGQLGNGTTDYSSAVPVEVQGVNDATQITAGVGHTCALRQTGTITCWGNNDSGQLGNGTTDSSSVPVEVLGVNDATQITAGGSHENGHTCALRQDGTITCWGNNRSVQLGAGAFLPLNVVGFGG